MSVRIDAHQHFWELARGDYRWLTPASKGLYRDFGPADLLPRLHVGGIDRTVLVQAADSVAETEYLLALAARHELVAGVVGWVDLEAPDACDVLTRLARHDKLVGVRPMLQDLADDEWLLRPALAPALRALVELDLRFDALVLPRHLRHLRTFVERHPELAVVVDHGAKPRIADGGRAWSGFAAWRAELSALSAFPNVSVKLSGLATEAQPDWHAADLRPFVEVLLDSFGPARCMWGSDWPVVELAGGYERWWDATDVILRALDSRERDAVFGGNAQRFYGLPLLAAGSVTAHDPRTRRT